MADWRSGLLARTTFEPSRDSDGVRYGRVQLGGREVVLAVWDFAVYGGSFGVAASQAFAAACDAAAGEQRPLVSLIRSGGTRLQEGVAALAGMPRAVLALDRLAAAGRPHLAVCDAPTTGGVWVTVGSRADVRIAVEGATVGFAGPRVVEALTGELPDKRSHRAETAWAAGLVDAVLAPGDVEGWLEATLRLLGPTQPRPAGTAPLPTDAGRGPWAQVLATRAAERSGGTLLARLLDEPVVPLRGADPTVVAALGRLGGRPVVACALGAEPGQAPGVSGFGLLRRAAETAGRLGRALVTVVDTPGADARGAAENAGLAPAIGEAMAAVLRCPTPTLGILLGEGGSGGALAALATDRLWLARDSYFAALVPEGAAAALKSTPELAAGTLRLTPREVGLLPFCDGLIDVGSATPTLTAAYDALVEESPDDLLRARRARWG